MQRGMRLLWQPEQRNDKSKMKRTEKEKAIIVMEPDVTTKWIRNKEGHKYMANNAAIAQWMKQHNLIPEESFAAALRRLAEQYQKENHIRSMEDVYQKIGLRKEYLYYWEKHPYSAQTKNF